MPLNTKRIVATSTLLLLTGIVPPTHAQPQSTAQVSPRQRILFDAGWRFYPDHFPSMTNASAIVDWRIRQAATADEPVPTDASGPDWADAHSGDDVFHGRLGFEWFVTNLPQNARAADIVHFDSIDDNGTIYLNGVKLLHHAGWDDPFDVPLKSAWNPAGPNVLSVLVENTAGPGGVTGVSFGLPRPEAAPSMTDPHWRMVHLPHDYLVEGTFTADADTGHGSLPKFPAWYAKDFILPAADRGKSVWIDFDGVYRDSKVYLNGRLLGEHQSGYTPFRYDISSIARYGTVNHLTVHVDPRRNEGWWYEGAGIYRHVWMNVANPTHIAPWGTFVRSTVRNVSAKPSATLTIETDIDDPSAGCVLVSTIFDPDGRRVGEKRSPIAGVVSQTIDLSTARLWSLEKPQLYRLHSVLAVGGRVVDSLDTPFGIRTIRFDPETGFYLNEKPVKIKGVCNHQDFAGLGVGLPDTLETWRVARLKQMGCNAWRTSHNPPNSEVLDACDRLGMLVMDENRHLGDTFTTKTSPGTPYSDMSEVDSMVLRDRNHPSVIMWSMCNEEPLQNTDEGGRIFAAMRDSVRKLDSTRPVTVAMNSGEYGGISTIEDIVGINYNIWAYDRFHRDHPSIPLYGSETSSEVSTRGVYDTTPFTAIDRPFEGVPDKGYVNEYGVNVPGWANSSEDAWSALAEHSYMAGGFVWTGFDYKGEPTPFGWPDINSNFGILDEAGFPKDRFYYYQSVWGDKPMVHILPHWNWAGREGQPIRVWAYSNADRVDLLLNGKSLGAQEMPKWRHLAWSVPYAPGVLEARAYQAGKLVAVDRVVTTGAPAALRLKTDRTTMAADGEDVILIETDVVDAQGRVVPTAGARVSFAVSGVGRVAGVGNGDPSDHDPDQASYRRAFAGKCLAIVGKTDRAGRTVLTATSPGLRSASVVLIAK